MRKPKRLKDTPSSVLNLSFFGNGPEIDTAKLNDRLYAEALRRGINSLIEDGGVTLEEIKV